VCDLSEAIGAVAVTPARKVAMNTLEFECAAVWDLASAAGLLNIAISRR
jgi:hypothetical protein